MIHLHKSGNNQAKEENWLLKRFKALGMEGPMIFFFGAIIGGLALYVLLINKPDFTLQPVIALAVNATVAARTTEIAADLIGTYTSINNPTSTMEIPSRQTPEPTKTDIVNPSATIPPTAQLPSSTPTPYIIFEDDFSDNDNGWDIGIESTGTDEKIREISGGKLRFKIRCGTALLRCEDLIDVPFVQEKNFKLAIESMITDLSNNGKVSVGIKYRIKDERNYYLVMFSSQGTYKFLRAYNGQWVDVQQEQSSHIIETEIGSGNKYSIIVNDSKFRIFVNDHQIYQTEENYFSQQGSISIGVIAQNSSEAEVEFDNLLITSH